MDSIVMHLFVDHGQILMNLVASNRTQANCRDKDSRQCVSRLVVPCNPTSSGLCRWVCFSNAQFGKYELLLCVIGRFLLPQRQRQTYLVQVFYSLIH